MKKCLHISLFILISFSVYIGCGKTDKPAAQADKTETQNSAAVESSSYIDISGWDLAQKEIKTIEKSVEAFNNFYDVWGLAYQYRTFLSYKEAIETADQLPGRLEEIKKITGKINAVPNYPEIESIKNCYAQMIPQLESGAQNLKDSIIAARDNKTAEEKKQITSYTEKWKAAMEYSRKSFTIFQELLTRGSRVEFSRLPAGQLTAPYNAGTFRKIISSAAAEYDKSVTSKISSVKKLASGSQWDVAIIKADEIYSILQKSIMKVSQAEPGKEKANWNIRQELVATLSSSMMAMKKFGEYMEFSKNGNSEEAVKTLKVYVIMEKSAADSRKKLRKLGY